MCVCVCSIEKQKLNGLMRERKGSEGYVREEEVKVNIWLALSHGLVVFSPNLDSSISTFSHPSHDITEPSLHTHRVRSSIQAIVWLSLHNSVILLECAPARTHNLILAFAISRILTALAGQLPIFGLKYIRPSKHSTKDSAHDPTHAVASSQRSFVALPNDSHPKR